MMQGQTLPSLGVAKEISQGKLPNGIRYYLVTNPSAKGFADYALAEKSFENFGRSRAALEDLDHFSGRSIERFIAQNGIPYSPSGLIEYRDEATVYNFRNVPVHNQEVADSTLLMIMDIAAKSTKPQAIVISGDINASKIKERMQLLSMTVGRLEDDDTEDEYAWIVGETARFVQSRNLSDGLAMLKAIYKTERTPRNLLVTPQPLLTSFYADILAEVFSNKIKAAFLKENLPLAAVQCEYIGSAESAGDELFCFSIFAPASRVSEAAAVMASVLSSLDNHGAAKEEFALAKQDIKKLASRMSSVKYLTNKEYVDKCLSSFLYGSNLAASSATYGFVASNNLAVEQELPIFNNFVSAVLDKSTNLSFRTDLPEGIEPKEDIESVFNQSWDKAASRAFGNGNIRQGFKTSSKPLSKKDQAKLKVKRESIEPISGGKMLTFSNDIRVILKKLPTEGEFHYALVLRGGTASVPELRPGESAFVQDMPSLSDVQGLHADEFRDALRVEGITMDISMSLSDLRISGQAPKDRLPLLMSAIQSFAYDRRLNQKEFERYKNEEALRLDMLKLTPQDRVPVMDSLMRPNFHFADAKRIENLSEDLPQRVDQSLVQSFSKVNDGFLILAGDFDEEQVEKDLSRALVSFKTQGKLSRRPQVSGAMALGSVTHTELSRSGAVGAAEIGVDFAISASAPFSIKNYMSFKIAAEGIRLALIEELADQGAYVEMLCRNEIYPVERVSLFFKIRPVPAKGLPAAVSPADNDIMLAAVRRVYSKLETIKLSDKDLKAYKSKLLAEYESSLANPEGVIDAAIVRYSDGRDVVTGYKEAINSVSHDNIKEILTLIASGASVEYIVN